MEEHCCRCECGIISYITAKSALKCPIQPNNQRRKGGGVKHQNDIHHITHWANKAALETTPNKSMSNVLRLVYKSLC